jgi:Arc/MetJ-type ribon-helix-helix transcriptional regulator
MPISVRLPPRVEQKLAEYCVSHKVTRSEAVKHALERMLDTNARSPSPYELGSDIFQRHERVKPTEDVARHSKRLLRERFRGKAR